MKLVMNGIISNPQGVSMARRQILDGELISNECVDDMIKSGKNGILVKLDLKKAYDHINWTFLHYMMGTLGFGSKWRNQMYVCYSLVAFSILINGFSKVFSEVLRGLRQGDLFSPYLFIMVMKALNIMIRKANDAFLSAFVVGHGDVPISHLQYAGDTMFFCDADIQS